MYHLHKWFNIIYSIEKVFILNQIKSCGLSNLVESQSTCNKKIRPKKANNASVYNLTSQRKP